MEYYELHGNNNSYNNCEIVSWVSCFAHEVVVSRKILYGTAWDDLWDCWRVPMYLLLARSWDTITLTKTLRQDIQFGGQTSNVVAFKSCMISKSYLLVYQFLIYIVIKRGRYVDIYQFRSSWLGYVTTCVEGLHCKLRSQNSYWFNYTPEWQVKIVISAVINETLVFSQ
jgi:hypothetical protein